MLCIRRLFGRQLRAGSHDQRKHQCAIRHYPSLTANTVRIQTLNRVVYLTGLVDTDVERLLAVSVAGDVQGVTRVVDSISVNNVPR
jgi:hypothetical protein